MYRSKKATKAIALALTLSLTVPMAVPMRPVEAQEAETQETETQETETQTDKEYVVFIDVSGKVPDTDNDNASTVGVNMPENVSENTLGENSLTKVDGTFGEDGTEEEKIHNQEGATAQSVEECVEKAEEILQDAGREVAGDQETIMYEADLTKKEIQELQELQEGNVSIVVEENIEFFGAGKKGESKGRAKKEQERKEQEKKEQKKKEQEKKEQEKKEQEKKEQEKKEQKKEEPKKQETVEETEAESQEPEWNISMVHGDVNEASVQPEGERIKIAVMDSGIELLSGIPVEQINNLVASEEYLPYYMNDMTGHGTAIAGIINDMIPGSKGHTFHACMEKYDFGTRKT